MTLEQIYGYVAIGIWVIVGIFVLIGALKGRSRGIGRQAVRTVTVAGSLLLSLFLTKLLYRTLMTWLDGKTTEEIIEKIESFGLKLTDGEYGGLIKYFDTQTANYVLAIPLAIVVVPVVFVVVFGIVNLLSLIIHAILSGILGFSKRRNNWFTRLLGAILGAAQGAAVAIICFVPWVGILTTATDAVAMVQKEAPDAEATASITESYDEYLKPLAESLPITLMDKCGAGILYDRLSTVEIYENKYKMAEEITTVAVKLYASGERLSGMDWQSLTEENKKEISAMLEAIDESSYISITLSRILSAAATAYDDGAYRFTAEGHANDILADTVGIFREMNEKELVPTLAVVKDVYFTLSDENVIARLSGGSTAELKDTFTKKDENGATIITRVKDQLSSNPRTEPLIGTISRISVTVMAHSYGAEIDEETYANVTNGIKDVINIKKSDYATEEEYVDAISDKLDTTLSENGIEVDDDILEGMAQHVADNYADKEGELSDSEIDDIILSYYDAYAEYLEASGEINPDDLP